MVNNIFHINIKLLLEWWSFKVQCADTKLKCL